jgi:hypothetical protein
MKRGDGLWEYRQAAGAGTLSRLQRQSEGFLFSDSTVATTTLAAA